MKSFLIASALATAGLVSAKVASLERRASLPTVSVKGNGDNRFYVRGLDYQPGGSSDAADPLADPRLCKRDIAEFKKLNINAIRVYITDNSANHDECMKALADAGIYVILDANNPLYSINRIDPVPSYNEVYLQSVFATIDAFIKYDNLLAFFSGNEVINDVVNSTLAAKYVKATTRDMRRYIRERKYRQVPVGYSAADVSQNRIQMAHYMNCGTDDERSDFFAFNDYSWCSSNLQTSGWDQKVKAFDGYGIPIFLSEYGCIKSKRDFGEVQALMSSDMTSVYSGGLMYEYALEENGYGIAKIEGDKVTELAEFAKFATAMSSYPPPKGDGGYSKTSSSVACPVKDETWLVDSTLLPAIPEGAVKFMRDGAGKGPGLAGPGSQNAQGTSTGDATPGSGSATATPTGGSHGHSAAGTMAPFEKAPFVVSGIAFVFTLFGAFLL